MCDHPGRLTISDRPGQRYLGAGWMSHVHTREGAHWQPLLPHVTLQFLGPDGAARAGRGRVCLGSSCPAARLSSALLLRGRITEKFFLSTAAALCFVALQKITMSHHGFMYLLPVISVRLMPQRKSRRWVPGLLYLAVIPQHLPGFLAKSSNWMH